jgi:heat shock protein Hsp20
MAIVRYEPWSLHRDLLNEVNKVFGRALEDEPSSAATADWMPAVDIEEYSDRFVLHADVPGVEPDAIDITLENGVLTIAGSREQRVAKKEVQGVRVERTSGRFFRRFNLPDTVDSESVSAHNRNGVLEITIPKRPTSQPRKIAVNH